MAHLPSHPMHLAERIRERREEILSRWESAVRVVGTTQPMRRPALIDEIPSILERIAQMADVIAAGEPPEFSLPLVESQVVLRVDQGFAFASIVRELSVLRDSILGLWRQAFLDEHAFAEFRAVSLAIDRAIAASAERYAKILDERRQQESTQLRERELPIRTLADNIPQLAWMADDKGNLLWANQRWYDFTGLTIEETRTDGWRRVQHPDHVARISEKLRSGLATGDAWEDTFPMRGKEGRFRWFLTRAAPIRGTDPTATRWFGTNTDITDQRFLDEATNVLATMLDDRAMLDRIAHLAVPDIADGCIIHRVESDRSLHWDALALADSAKLAAARAWVERDPAARRRVADVIRTTEPVYAAQVDLDQLAQGLEPELAAMVRELGLASYVIAPIHAHGCTFGAITLISTESGRRFGRSDVELAMALGRRTGTAIDNVFLYKQARCAVRQRDDVLAVVSHDLRNPLGAIDLSATLLLQAHGAEPHTHRQLDIIQRSARRMDHMISDLLDMASIETGKLSLERRPEDAIRLVTEACEAHEAMAAEKQITLVRDCALDGVVINCDRDRIAQVFGNLIGNAIKFCPAGSTLTLRGRRTTADRARFELADNGPGIAEQDLPHLFEPYWSSRRHTKHGTGLGLFISKGLVEAHGGTLSVASRLGAGTTFVVELPVAERTA